MTWSGCSASPAAQPDHDPTQKGQAAPPARFRLTPILYFDNVEFLKGEPAAIPLPDDSVDVIISNRVIS